MKLTWTFALLGCLGLPTAIALAAAAAPPCPPPAGTVDDSFWRESNPEFFLGSATSAAELSDGRILVGMIGTYATGGASPLSRDILVRLQSDGTLDPTFTFTATNYERIWQTHTFAVASNGLIAAATSGPGTSGFFYGQFHVLRPDGDIVLTAQTGVDNSSLVLALAWQTDGRLLLGGRFGGFLPGLPASLGRLHPDSRVDSSFSPPTDLDPVFGLAVDGAGRILAHTGVALRRLLPNGSPDPSFRTPEFTGTCCPWYPDGQLPVLSTGGGKILVGGAFTAINGVARRAVARLNEDGSLDETFDAGTGPTGGWSERIVLTEQSDGKILVGGHFSSFSGVARMGLVRLRANGSMDVTFDAGSQVEYGSSVSLQRDGRLLVTDYMPSFRGNMSPHRLRADPIPRLSLPEWVTPTRVRLQTTSVPGADYVLQSSTNLGRWQDLATNTARDCSLAFTNDSSGASARFFRIRRPSESELGR